jgi:hypothetical protein
VVTGAFLVGVITRDKLVRMGVETEEEAEVEPAADGSVECAACGGHKGVRRDLRTGMLSLCTDCAAVMPATDPPRGN